MRTMVKRIFSIGVCGLIIVTPITSNAWGGYTHWEISDRVASNNGMRSTVANYYKSGALMADIGKSTWDDDYTISDSRSFAREMLQIARKSKFSSHVNFASGWYDHYLQDSKGSVANITGGPSSYRVKCGWIDELTTLEKEIVEDGVYKVTYVILDQEAYDQKVQELADKIRLEY